MEENKPSEDVSLKNNPINFAERRIIKISRKKFKWTVIVVVVLFIGLFLFLVAISSLSSARSKSSSSYDSAVMSPSSSSYGDSGGETQNINSDYYRYREQNPSISDTREFLKTSYSSNIQTRDVSEVVTDVKNIVKGADGRIDSIISGEKYGRVSFVVAKSKFDAFRDEIESITHKKLYTENISSENLLSEKQGIEEQTSNVVESLDGLISEKNSLLVAHNKTVSDINKELAKIQSELTKVRANISVEENVEILASLRSQETLYIKQYAVSKQKITDENNIYATKVNKIDNQINYQNKNLTNINKQDVKFMDNVETVNGYVSVSWISLWSMAVIFAPIHPTWIIIILIILGVVLLRKKAPRVEFV